jgi:hypothetical protein
VATHVYGPHEGVEGCEVEMGEGGPGGGGGCSGLQHLDSKRILINVDLTSVLCGVYILGTP